MKKRVFRELLASRFAQHTYACVGLDSDYAQIVEIVRRPSLEKTILDFNCPIIDATRDLVCAYKINIAFYEAYGPEGILALMKTVAYINERAPDVPVILDAKCADIGIVNLAYVKLAFDLIKADAITLNPYMGFGALLPFFARENKGIFIVCRTSNPGAGEFQDIEINGTPLYLEIARHAVKWNVNKNCGLVVGATCPGNLFRVREEVGEMLILIPGVGSQGADLKQSVINGVDANGSGIIVNSSRSIIFASAGPDFAEAARRETMKLRDEINHYRDIFLNF